MTDWLLRLLKDFDIDVVVTILTVGAASIWRLSKMETTVELFAKHNAESHDHIRDDLKEIKNHIDAHTDHIMDVDRRISNIEGKVNHA